MRQGYAPRALSLGTGGVYTPHERQVVHFGSEAGTQYGVDPTRTPPPKNETEEE